MGTKTSRGLPMKIIWKITLRDPKWQTAKMLFSKALQK
jgi:hypothetical protein